MSIGLATVGVPNVPQGTMDQVDFFRWVRNTLVQQQEALLPPTTPTNVRATALAGAVQVDFTRSDGDAYVLYWNSTPSINLATRVDLGTANIYVDNIGDGSITRYYAIRAKKGDRNGELSPWVSATTLALGTAVTPPTPPPASDTPFTDQETDSVGVQIADRDTFIQI